MGVLGLTAPRGLLVINATRDAHQFSVGEAKKSLARTEPVFRLYGREDHVRHTIFESHHDYSRPMREAMYGWMKLRAGGRRGRLANRRAGDHDRGPRDPPLLPRQLPARRLDDDPPVRGRAGEEAARSQAGRERCRPVAANPYRLLQGADRDRLRRVPAGLTRCAPGRGGGRGAARVIHFQPEPGLNLTARVEAGKSPGAPLAIVLDLEGARKAAASGLAEEVRRAGWELVTLDLRTTGTLAGPKDRAAGIVDHNPAQWGIWLGRPLLGQWALDVQRLLDTLERVDNGLPPQVAVIGEGPAGLVALAAGAVDQRITKVAAVRTLASYRTDVPYEGQRLGLMAPGILRHVGDVADLAALVAPGAWSSPGVSRAAARHSPSNGSRMRTRARCAFGASLTPAATWPSWRAAARPRCLRRSGSGKSGEFHATYEDSSSRA